MVPPIICPVDKIWQPYSVWDYIGDTILLTGFFQGLSVTSRLGMVLHVIGTRLPFQDHFWQHYSVVGPAYWNILVPLWKSQSNAPKAEDTQDVNLITLHALRENGTEFQKVYEPHFMAFLIRASYSFFVVFFFVCAYAYKLLSVPSWDFLSPCNSLSTTSRRPWAVTDWGRITVRYSIHVWTFLSLPLQSHHTKEYFTIDVTYISGAIQQQGEELGIGQCLLQLLSSQPA